MSYCEVRRSESNRLPRRFCIPCKRTPRDATNTPSGVSKRVRTRTRDNLRSPMRAVSCRIDECFVGIEPTAPRAGIEPASLTRAGQRRTTMFLLHQMHDVTPLKAARQNDESRLGDRAAFTKTSRKTA